MSDSSEVLEKLLEVIKKKQVGTSYDRVPRKSAYYVGHIKLFYDVDGGDGRCIFYCTLSEYFVLLILLILSIWYCHRRAFLLQCSAVQ